MDDIFHVFKDRLMMKETTDRVIEEINGLFDNSTSNITEPVGYHITPIEKGVIGELSKIREEVEEAIDAELQGCDIMVLLELSDVIGAIDMYLQRKHPTITLESLMVMTAITQRAFKTGARE